MDLTKRKNPNSKKGTACTPYNARVSGTDIESSLTNSLEVLKQHFTCKSNLTEIAAVNPPSEKLLSILCDKLWQL